MEYMVTWRKHTGKAKSLYRVLIFAESADAAQRQVEEQGREVVRVERAHTYEARPVADVQPRMRKSTVMRGD